MTFTKLQFAGVWLSVIRDRDTLIVTAPRWPWVSITVTVGEAEKLAQEITDICARKKDLTGISTRL